MRCVALSHRGFVALTSVIIISAILLMLVFSLGTSSFFNRFDSFDRENKRVSQDLAEACAHTAMLRFTRAEYAGGTVVVSTTSPPLTCKICTITSAGLIQTRAAYNGAYTNLTLRVSKAAGIVSMNAWSETPSGPLGCALP